ncbi:MAG TPA: ribose-5-phosphate isomerase RpiA [Thermoleophilaceae bacterium]|nr:ribose-5-phosphate isomerase RpiA [Thermoleophilaceae bacterium]
MASSGASEPSPGRTAAAEAAVELMEPDMAIGLGSGRAVWAVIEAIGGRFPDGHEIRAVVASEATFALAQAAGIEIVQLDGSLVLDLAVDGADEVGPDLQLLKGGGGALLREKIVAAAAERFVVVAETTKKADRLGQGFRLPVEIVRFGWRDTRRRLADLLPESELRAVGDEPYMTDQLHHILDCTIPEGTDPHELADALEKIPGVVEHGLFLGIAERALLGTPEGGVEVIERS